VPLAAGGASALDRLLAYVPRSMIGPLQGGTYWHYADTAQQFASLNLHHSPEGLAVEGGPWILATFALAVPSGAFMYALDEEFVDAIGFQPWGVDQTLEVGKPPDTLTLFRGAFDEGRLEAAWAASGYERRETEAGDLVWSLNEANDVDFEHPIGRAVFSAFNNLAVRDGEVLLGAATMTMLEDAIATRRSGEGSLAFDPDLTTALQTMPATMVSAIAAGPVLSAARSGGDWDAIRASLADSDATVGPMPSNLGIVLGVTAGAVYIEEDVREDLPFDAPDPAAGEGLALIRLRLGSAEDAEQAIEVVEYRWGRMSSLRYQVPYADVMEIVSATALGSIAAFNFIQLRGAHSWMSLLPNRDLLPFEPSPAE
jgi:hypothetical protein